MCVCVFAISKPRSFIFDEISEYEVFFEVDVYSWNLSEADLLIKHYIALFFGCLWAVFFLV